VLFSISNLTKEKLPQIRWEIFKNKALGGKYSLSLVICRSSLSRKLNKERRSKDKAANVLSFPLSDNLGEIFIDINVAKKEASAQKSPLKEQLEFLYVHGLAHLAGHTHGARMDRFERVIHNK